MEVVGQDFDPTLHEAVLREESHDHREDVVIEELQRGYHLNGKVLRHAMVKVSMGPGPSTDGSDSADADQPQAQEG
jgi:molecular chaperone GrpE